LKKNKIAETFHEFSHTLTTFLHLTKESWNHTWH